MHMDWGGTSANLSRQVYDGHIRKEVSLPLSVNDLYTHVPVFPSSERKNAEMKTEPGPALPKNASWSHALESNRETKRNPQIVNWNPPFLCPPFPTRMNHSMPNSENMGKERTASLKFVLLHRSSRSK